MNLWDCHKCGAPGVRNLLSQGWCAAHLARLYHRFNPATFEMAGLGIPPDSAEPDSLGYLPLRCTSATCGATWSGLMLDPCPFCAKAYDKHVERIRARVLRRPEHPTDEVMAAWAVQLRDAIDSGLITRREGRDVWRKAVVTCAA